MAVVNRIVKKCSDDPEEVFVNLTMSCIIGVIAITFEMQPKFHCLYFIIYYHDKILIY